MVLAVADPMAALIGRRWGRTRLCQGRSLEGTAAFVVSGMIITMAVLAIFYPGLGLGAMLLTAFLASLTGGIAELVSGRLDDNFTIPLAAAAGATLALTIVGA